MIEPLTSANTLLVVRDVEMARKVAASVYPVRTCAWGANLSGRPFNTVIIACPPECDEHINWLDSIKAHLKDGGQIINVWM